MTLQNCATNFIEKKKVRKIGLLILFLFYLLTGCLFAVADFLPTEVFLKVELVSPL